MNELAKNDLLNNEISIEQVDYCKLLKKLCPLLDKKADFIENINTNTYSKFNSRIFVKNFFNCQIDFFEKINSLLEQKIKDINDYKEVLKRHIDYNPNLNNCNVIVVDINNFITKFFNYGNKKHSDLVLVDRKIKYFCRYCKKIKLDIHIFIDIFRTNDGIKKWKERTIRNIKLQAGGIPCNCSIIIKELFQKYINKDNIHFCCENEADIVIASWAEKYMNENNKDVIILSGDRGFFGYKWKRLPIILKNFRIICRNNLKKDNDIEKKIIFYRHDNDKRYPIDTFKTIPFLSNFQTISDYRINILLEKSRKKLLGTCTSIFYFYDINDLLKKVRQAFYYSLFQNESVYVKEIKPKLVNSRDKEIKWVEEEVLCDSKYLYLLKNDPLKLIENILNDFDISRVRKWLLDKDEKNNRKVINQIYNNVIFGIYSIVLSYHSNINNISYIETLKKYYYEVKICKMCDDEIVYDLAYCKFCNSKGYKLSNYCISCKKLDKSCVKKTTKKSIEVYF